MPLPVQTDDIQHEMLQSQRDSVVRKLARPLKTIGAFIECRRQEDRERLARFETWLEERKAGGERAPAKIMSAVLSHIRIQAAECMPVCDQMSIATMHDEILYGDSWVMEALEKPLSFDTDYLLLTADGMVTIEDLAWLITYIKGGPEAKGEI